MAGETEICNLALMRLGAPPIADLDENSKNAIALKGVFGTVRDIVLRAHPWNFAMARVTLARLSETPPFGYSYAYQLPSDIDRLLGLVDGDGVLNPTIQYQMEGQKILTNEATVRIKYVRKITDPTLFDDAFTSAFVSRLAAETAYYITGSAAMKKQMMEEYLLELREARSIDAQENPPEVYESNDWDDARE